MSVRSIPSKELSKWRLYLLNTRHLWFHEDEDIENLPIFTDEQKKEIRVMFDRPQTSIEVRELSEPRPRPQSAYKLPLDVAEEDVDEETTRARAQHGLDKLVNYFINQQAEDGTYPCDHPCLEFTLPSLVFIWYLDDVMPDGPVRSQIISKILNTQLEIGGWALTEHNSTPILFTSTINYVALRMLGCDPAQPEILKARRAIHHLGGALRSPTWGKWMLCTLGLYEWRGMQSLGAELWMLPKWLPFHPCQLWPCLRVVYAPMAYVQGLLRDKPNSLTDTLLLQVREEIYCEVYHTIEWEKHRLDLCENDAFAPPGRLLKAIYWVFNKWEEICPQYIRQQTLDYLFKVVHAEDIYTDHIQRYGFAKNAAMLAKHFHSGNNTDDYSLHIDRCRDYMWPSYLGLRMKSGNGMHCWDVANATQGLVEAFKGRSLTDDVKGTLIKSFHFMMKCQVTEDLITTDPNNLRQYDLGAFPYAALDRGNTCSDTTSESLTAVLQLIQLGCTEPVPNPDLHWRVLRAVDCVLGFQCEDGGCGAFEARRGPLWLDHLNPVEIFEGCVTELSHVETTYSSLNALVTFQQTYPGGKDYRKKDLDRFVNRGLEYIKKHQHPDGGWRASWGACFTYGAAYCLRAFAVTGNGYLTGRPVPTAVEKGCRFILRHQNGDGGWGEDYSSVLQHQYQYAAHSGVCHTALALIGLMSVKHPAHHQIRRGIEYLIRTQSEEGDLPDGMMRPDGSPSKWWDGAMHGAANTISPLIYPNYRNYHPMMALGMYGNDYYPSYGKHSNANGCIDSSHSNGALKIKYSNSNGLLQISKSNESANICNKNIKKIQ